ncbi:MAG: transcriptional repressor [Dysgonamonadaceae bacterium]|jgi:Fur family ferric uptake transcriptional regulator/Fur family peroxide stress response transcriptional regulator|nr:transcriptional repressor [Dysgonamonadaceae bacterium]
MELAKIKERLSIHNIRPSLHRIAILDFLLENPIHPTVDMIYNELYHSIPTLSKTTVYNTLKLLEENGAVQSIQIDDKFIRYDANLSVHAHFKCKECGCIRDLFSDNLAHLKNMTINPQLMISECQIYYKGYCERCKKKIN